MTYQCGQFVSLDYPYIALLDNKWFKDIAIKGNSQHLGCKKKSK